MAQKIWYDAKGVGERYSAGPKWVYYIQKNDPKFPQGVRFSNGMTRWNADRLDEYDRLKSGVAADD